MTSRRRFLQALVALPASLVLGRGLTKTVPEVWTFKGHPVVWDNHLTGRSFLLIDHQMRRAYLRLVGGANDNDYRVMANDH